MKRQISYDDYEKLRVYCEERNKENWGMWPAVEEWPVPDSLGAWSASQYEVRKQNVTVLKFDNMITLPDGRVAKKLLLGRFIPFKADPFKKLDKEECEGLKRQLALLPRLKEVNFESRITAALERYDIGDMDDRHAAALAVCEDIGREVVASAEDVWSAYYL